MSGNTTTYKYISERSKKIHKLLCDVKKLHITKLFFSTSEKFKDEFARKWTSYDDFEFYTNRYLWETYFRYDEEIIKALKLKSNEIIKKHISNEEKLIEFFLFCYSVAPKGAPVKEKEFPKGNVALSLEDLLLEDDKEEDEEKEELEGQDKQE